VSLLKCIEPLRALHNVALSAAQESAIIIGLVYGNKIKISFGAVMNSNARIIARVQIGEVVMML